MKLATLRIRIGLVLAMVVVLAIFLMPTFANAATWYVSPTGDDTNNGTEGNPWRTIQHAVDQAALGDTIKVMDDDNEATDDYVENITVDKRLTIERNDDIGANPQVKAENADNHVFNVTADNVTIRGLDIYEATDVWVEGIYLNSVSGCTIENNRCGWDDSHYNYYGIYLDDSDNNTLSDNTCSNNSYGIWLSNSSNNTVSGNICNSNNHYGIYLYSSSNNNTLSGNTCNSNNDYGISLYSSSNNTLSGNTCSNNYCAISLDSSSNNTLSDNTCNSNNVWGILLDGSYNTLSDNTCNSNNNYGIRLGGSYNTLSGNTCNSNNDYGIYLHSSSNNNTLSGNTCSNNNYGIRLSGSYNTLSGNTCSNNVDYGISLWSSSNNIVSDNTCSNNDYGIHLSYSSNNTVSGNTSNLNDYHGIYLESSSNNTIYLNIFSNNFFNAYSVASTNIWHSPTKLGYLYGSSTQTKKSFMGNYYDDYSGSDSDNDGIGDTPYDLPYDEPDDEYPLMQPTDNYSFQVWWLADPIMYREDMSQPGATVTISSGSYQIWAADEAALTDTPFGAGDPIEETTWTGQVTFASAPVFGDTFTVEIGYADDQDGSNFWEDGPEAMLVGNGSDISFTYITNALAITVPSGKYLALRITNNSSSDYSVRVGGSWSYVSAPLSISGYVRGDVSGNGTVTAYDAAMVLQYVVELITFTDTQIEAADVSNNEIVSAYDAALILQYVIGLIPSFPEESETGAPILNAKSESEMLAKVIEELEDIRLDDEQKRVVEQLKRLLSNQQPIPVYTALLQNYPNPFNPETWIPYQLATDSPVMISIYNAKGQMIRTISLGTKQAGIYITKDRAAYWDGNDSFGQPVAS